MGNSSNKIIQNSEKTLLLHNSLVNSLQKNKFNIRYILIIILLSSMEVINLLNMSITQICCFNEFKNFWVSVSSRFFTVLYFVSYFAGRGIGSIACNVLLNWVSFMNLFNLFLVLSILSNFSALFNLAPVNWLQLNNNAVLILIFRFVSGLSSGNTVLIKSYIFKNFKEHLFNFCIIFGIIEFFFFSVSPILGNYIKISLDFVVSLIPTLPDYFFYPFFDTFTFSNTILGVFTFVFFILSFFIFKNSENLLFKYKKRDNVLVNTSSSASSNKNSRRMGGLRFLTGLLFSVISWVMMYELMIYNTLYNRISEKLEDIFTYEIVGLSMLLIVPLLSLAIYYTIYFVVVVSIKRYRRKWIINAMKQRKLYSLIVFLFVCIIYVVAMIAFFYWSNFSTFDFLMVLFCFSVITSVVLPFIYSGVIYFFVYALDNVYATGNINSGFGYFTMVESVSGLISALVILSVELSSILIVGSSAVLTGMACFTLIIAVFHFNDRINPTQKDNFLFGNVSVLGLPAIESLEFQFHLIGDSYDVHVNKKRQVVVKIDDEKDFDKSVFFHRNFQHKNIFRIKGHVKTTSKNDFFVIFEKFDPEYKIMTLEEYLKKKRKLFPWNEKINLALSIIEIISELHSASYFHGYLSVWNVIVFLKKNSIKKFKLLYVGDVKKKYSVFSQELDERNDINIVGTFLLELFEEKAFVVSPYRFLLPNNRTIDIPFTAIRQCSQDELQFSVSLRQKKWRSIQSILMECFKKHPIITCDQVLVELKKCKFVENVRSINKFDRDGNGSSSGTMIIEEEEEEEVENIEKIQQVSKLEEPKTFEFIEIKERSPPPEQDQGKKELEIFAGKVENIIGKIKSNEKRTELKKLLDKYVRVCRMYKKDSKIVKEAREELKSTLLCQVSKKM